MPTLTRRYYGPMVGPAKRRRLTYRDLRLQRQVMANRRELKYYDANIDLVLTAKDKSLFTETTANPTFIGRKVYIRRIELSGTGTGETNEDGFLTLQLYRVKRLGALTPPDPTGEVVTRYDPEFYQGLRDWRSDRNPNKINNFSPIFRLRFKGRGHLVQFDSQSTAVASGQITNGDIRVATADSILNTETKTLSIRVWYYDA